MCASAGSAMITAAGRHALQGQPRRGRKGADVVDPSDDREQDRGCGQRQQYSTLPLQGAGISATQAQATRSVAATTAMPPPCGVGCR